MKIIGSAFAAVGAIGCVVLLVVGGIAASLGYGYFIQPIVNDINRENQQRQQGYTEGKSQELLDMIRAYEDPKATDGQRTAIVNSFCYKYTLLIPSERPESVVQFATIYC